MNRYRALIFLLLLSFAILTLAFGSSGNRQLQAISIHSAVNGSHIQFSATGTFSASPITVNPLPVSWSYAPPPPRYTLSTQPFLFDCEHPESHGPIVAMAPADPDAPSSGLISAARMVMDSGPIPCGKR